MSTTNIMPDDREQYSYRYPHPAVTTDCCIFTFVSGDLAVLLIRRGLEPYRDMWALPGGFVRIDETAEDCARRELLEETGYDAARVTQFHTYSAVNRDPRERVITIAFYALVKWADVCGGDDAAEACWFNVDTLPRLAFDHQEIIADALRALKRDSYFEPLSCELLPPTFSMSDLQRVYEKIMRTTFDRRNFYNKMRNTEMAIEVDDSNENCVFDNVSEDVDMSYSTQSCDSTGCHHDIGIDSGSGVWVEELRCGVAPKVSKERPQRRANVKYRFNQDKFRDNYSDNDEPFKI